MSRFTGKFSGTLQARFGGRGGLSGIALPRVGLLFYSRYPNTDEVLWGDDVVIDDQYYAYAGWILTASDAALFAASGSDWYSDVDNPIALRDFEILALTGINESNILFTINKGLAVYESTVSATVLAKAYKFFGL